MQPDKAKMQHNKYVQDNDQNIPKGYSEAINRRSTDNAITNQKIPKE
jgi:hypothetical protein